MKRNMKRFFVAILMVICGSISLVRANDYSKHIVVAKDGSGDFTSIQRAIESCKSFPYERITVYIKNGTYHEKVRIPEWNTKISLIGQSKDSTIIAYADYFNKINKGPNSTFYTATLTVEGTDFHAENLTIKNNSGPIGQAMALTVNADRCSFKNCRFIGNQDTIYLTGENARYYFNDCYIEGTTDFIFGQATALFEKCLIMCKDNSYITAASTSKSAEFGFVFNECQITAASNVTEVFLGRPWRKYAQTVFINCKMGDFIRPEGWNNWNNSENEKTVYYAEYHSRGQGATPTARAKWSHQLTDKQVREYTIENIFKGIVKDWNPTEK